MGQLENLINSLGIIDFMWGVINRYKSFKRFCFIWVGLKKVIFLDQLLEREVRDYFWKKQKGQGREWRFVQEVRLGCISKLVSCWNEGYDGRFFFFGYFC